MLSPKNQESTASFPATLTVLAGRLLHQNSQLNLALIDQVLVSGVNFLTGIILARFLGLENFGIFSLLWIAVFFVNTLNTALVTSPMQSLGPKLEEEEQPAYYGVVLLQQLLLAPLLALVTVVGLWVLDQEWLHWQISEWLIPLLLVCFSVQMQDFMRRAAYARSRPKRAFVSDLISYGGQLIGLIVLGMAGGLTITSVLVIIAITSLLATGLVLPGAMVFDTKQFVPVLVRHWRFGSWLSVASLMQWVGSQGVILMAGGFLNASSLGGIRAVINLLAPVNLFLQGLQNVIPVRASHLLHHEGISAMQAYFRTSGIWMLGALGGICLTVFLLRDTLMLWVYGQEYLSFTPYILWQAVYVLLGGVALLQWFYFRTVEKTRPLAIVQMISVPFSLLAAWLGFAEMNEGAVFLGLIVNQVLTVLGCLALARVREKTLS